MSEYQWMLSLGLRGLSLVGVALGSLELALLVAQLRFATPAGHSSTGSLVRGVLLGLLVGSAVWLYGRSEPLAAAVWQAVFRRRVD